MAGVRIRDVAAEAGVSPATVSRYLNGRWSSMSRETRERVAAVIERTGYRPSSVARSLRLETSHTLGVVLADVRNPYTSEVLQELCDRAEDGGYALMCSFSENDPAREAAALERLVDARVDGLVINTSGGNDGLILDVARRVPTCLLDRAVEAGAARPGAGAGGAGALPGAGARGTLDLVTSDNERLVSELLDALQRSGVRRAVLLTEPVSTSATRRERAESFAAGLERRAMTGSVEGLGAGAPDVRDVLARVVGAGGGDGGRVGVVAVNGLVFLRVVEALGSLGAEPGRDVALATFDDYAWNRVLYGGVTTAAQDTARVAAEALELLLTRMADPSLPARRVEVPGSVIERASTASPATA